MSFSPGGLAPRGPQPAEMSLWKINQLIFNRRGGDVVTPVNLTPPSIAVQGGGSAIPGSILEGTPGTWSGSPTLTYQWQRDGAAIAGQTNIAGYTVTAADRGTILSLIEIPNGEVANAVSSNSISIEALAGIVLAARLQTHNGDNVPLGMYQDVACTIPATQDFDLVAAWRDELGESGVTVVQSDPDKQPMLIFDSGVPTIEFDGVDDWMGGALVVNPTSSMMFAVARSTTFAMEQHFFTLTNIPNLNAQSLAIKDVSEPRLFRNSGTFPFLTAGSGDVAVWNQWTAAFSGASAEIRVNSFSTMGTLEDLTSTGQINAGALHWNGGGLERPFSGKMVALLLAVPELPSGERDLVESYLVTISSPLL